MAKIYPFKAVLPAADKAGLVCSNSFETYTKEDLEYQLSHNPYSFLQIIKPEYKNSDQRTTNERLDLIKTQYQNFKSNGILKYQQDSAFYVYEFIDRHNHRFCGWLATASIEDYKNNVIKKHENTITHREVLFKNYLKSVRFNAEPVVLTYPNDSSLAKVMERLTQNSPDHQYSTEDSATHRLWKVSTPEHITSVQHLFESISALYIADGHHRTASSALLSSETPDSNSSNPLHRFMAYIIPESELIIHEYNRLIKDLNGWSSDDFIKQIEVHFKVRKTTTVFKPQQRHQFYMYLKGQHYCLSLRSNVKRQTPLEQLDTYILQHLILDPILGIKNVRQNNRISYCHGKDNLKEMQSKINQKEYAVGFGLAPLEISDITAIADHNLTMPPKSTYIYPRLKSAIAIYEF